MNEGAARPQSCTGYAIIKQSRNKRLTDAPLRDGTQPSVRVLDFTSPRADCVVSELLDAQLIGEGVLPTLRHAAEVLLAPDYRCVPAAATVWAQVVQCEHFAAMGPLRPVEHKSADATAVARGDTTSSFNSRDPVASMKDALPPWLQLCSDED